MPFRGSSHVIHLSIEQEEPSLKDRIIKMQQIVGTEQTWSALFPLSHVYQFAAF